MINSHKLSSSPTGFGSMLEIKTSIDEDVSSPGISTGKLTAAPKHLETSSLTFDGLVPRDPAVELFLR